MVVRPKSRLFTVEEYARIGEAGILGEDDRVELIDGEIVQMTAIGSKHASCVRRLNAFFSKHVADRAIVLVQDPVQVGEMSEPEPDLGLLRPRGDFYAAAHPGSGDILLLVEVADASLEYDRSVKARMYGAAGVPELWIVDLTLGQVEVHRSPAPDGYTEVRLLGAGDVLSPLAFPEVSLAVEDALGS